MGRDESLAGKKIKLKKGVKQHIVNLTASETFRIKILRYVGRGPGRD